MLWIKIALSTTSLETFNVCFEREEAIVRLTNFMMGSALGIMGKPLTLPSVLYVKTKRFHGLLRDPIARSRVFRLPNTLETPWNRQVPTSNANTGTEIQKCTWTLCIPTWQLSTFLLPFVLAFELSPFTRVKRERKKKRKRWRDAWRLSCPATYPQQGQTILRIVLLLGLLSFGILSLLVQKRDFSAKFKAKIRSYILSQSTIINSLLS